MVLFLFSDLGLGTVAWMHCASQLAICGGPSSAKVWVATRMAGIHWRINMWQSLAKSDQGTKHLAHARVTCRLVAALCGAWLYSLRW